MIKEYVKKSIITDSGFNAEANIAYGLWIDLKAGCAVIMLDQYKSFADREAGTALMGKKEVRVSGIEALPIFSAVHDAVVSTILADPQYVGGTLEQVEVPDPI